MDEKILTPTIIDPNHSWLLLPCWSINNKEFLRRIYSFHLFKTSAKFMSDLGDYLRSEMNYPKEAYRNKIQGKVILEFVIDDDGRITKAKVIQSTHILLSDEALRMLVRSSGIWIPGSNNNEYLPSYFSLPIHFNIPENK